LNQPDPTLRPSNPQAQRDAGIEPSTKAVSPVLRYGSFVFSVAGARVAGILITSLTFPYLVRHLGVETYGLWNYVLAVTAFLNILADPGFTTYAVQQVAARRQGGFELLADIFVLRSLSSAIALVILLIFTFLEVRLDVRQLLRLYGGGFIVVSLLSADRFLGAVEMFHARSVLIVTQQALYAAGIFVLIHTPKDVVWLPISILGSSALTAVAGWTVLWRCGYKLHATLHPEQWGGIIVPSAHYAFSSLMSTLYHRFGYFAVRWYLGDHALGLYSAAARLVDILSQFVTLVLYVLTPRMARSAKLGAIPRRLAQFTVGLVALISIPLAAGLRSTAHLLVPWILGQKYLEDIALLKGMSFYLITAPAASLLAGTMLYAMGRHRSYLIATSGGAVAGILLYLVLTPVFGLNGAGLGFVLAELFVAAIAYALLPRELQDLWKNPMILVATGGALLMTLLLKIAGPYVQNLLPMVVLGASVYLLSCGWFVRGWLGRELSSAE